MKRESRTVDRSHQVDSSIQRHLPLVDLLVETRAELKELAVASGLKVLTAMLKADRTAICGPRYQHQDEREASRRSRCRPAGPFLRCDQSLNRVGGRRRRGGDSLRRARRVQGLGPR